MTLLYLLVCPTLASAFPAFAQFQFAPNGVCIQPTHFVEPSLNKKFSMKNVPGEGDCVFLAVALASWTSVGYGANDVLLRAVARETRQVVAQVLTSPGNLVIEGKRMVSTKALLESAARGERKTPAEYIALLRKEGIEGGLYGGGPELTVLANVLRRPISVYELVTEQNGSENTSLQQIVCKGTFCEESFADPLHGVPDSAVFNVSELPGAFSWHLHILIVDASPNEKHACVLLPQNQ